MKKKFTFFGICVLLCTLMISLGSCQKDYSDDIDNLQEQINQNKSAIAALNSAIANGKIISGVSTVAGGYEITFSDNSTITIMHGTNGADGADGDDGAVGADGFTPIIGIDADGYWTVITTQGGTPERIKDVDGNEIMAAFSQELGVDNGYLTVGGVATTVKYSTLVFNSVTNTITVTLEDENGNLVTKTLKVAEDTFLANDLTSVVSPIGITKVLIGYSKVGSALTDVHATLGQEGLDFAGVELDEQLKSGGVMPIILNPSNVNTDDYTFEVIKSNGSLFVLQPETITSGYDGAFAQYATGSSNGLFSLNFTPELDDMLAAPALTKELAVRAVKGDREVVSGYQYEITVAAAGETTFAEKVAGSLTNPVYVAFSTTDNILDLLDRTDVTPIRTLTNGDFYKSELVVVPGSPNEDLNDHIIIDGTTGTAPDATLETVTDVSDQNIDYTLKTFDWKGIYKETDVDIVFYAPLDTEVADIDLGTHVLDATANTKEADLTPMFDALDAEGKKALWGAQATTVQVEIYDHNDVLVPAGFTYVFTKADNSNVSAATVIYDPLLVPVIQNVKFTIDPTIVIPGNYKAVLSFTDRRAYARGVEFKVNMPIVVENPDLTIDDLTAKKAHLFDGQKLVIYGTGSGSILQTDVNNFYYDLFNAYKNLGQTLTETAPVATANVWKFVSPSANPTALLSTTALTAANNSERFTFRAVANVLNVAEPNVAYPVELHYVYFGNPLNTDSLETIMVEARSEVYDGHGEAGTAAVEITNGDVVTTVTLDNTHYKVFDYLGNDLNIFAPTDTRVTGVDLEAPADQAHLLNIAPNGTTWDIKGTNNVAVINPTTVTIPLTLKVTDVLGLVKEYTINVTVTQP